MIKLILSMWIWMSISAESFACAVSQKKNLFIFWTMSFRAQNRQIRMKPTPGLTIPRTTDMVYVDATRMLIYLCPTTTIILFLCVHRSKWKVWNINLVLQWMYEPFFMLISDYSVCFFLSCCSWFWTNIICVWWNSDANKTYLNGRTGEREDEWKITNRQRQPYYHSVARRVSYILHKVFYK